MNDTTIHRTYARQPLVTIAFFTLLAFAGATEAAASTFDHAVWNKLLATYVNTDGKVAYERLAAEAKGDLDRYLKELAATDPSKLSPKQQIAFWINAYNAGVVAGILAGYSPESTFGRGRFFRWYAFDVAGEERTLDSIEHDVLRKQFSEPRIHFALVCAATSCPRLRPEAYIEATLDAQLDDQGRQFVNDPQRNQIDADGNVHLSHIFEWFAADFSKAAGSVRAFAARYVKNPEEAEAVRSGSGPIEYLEYDWTMNAAAGQRPE